MFRYATFTYVWSIYPHLDCDVGEELLYVSGHQNRSVPRNRERFDLNINLRPVLIDWDIVECFFTSSPSHSLPSPSLSLSFRLK